MERLRRLKPILFFHLLLNTLVVVFITGASYYHVPLEGFKDHGVYFLHLCLLQATVAGFLYFLSLYKWPFRIVFSTLFLGYCSFSFWAYTQDISVTPALIQGVFETKPDIAIDLITAPYFLFFLIAIAALILILKLHSRIQPRIGFAILVLPALACIFLYSAMERYQKGILMFRLPYNVIEGIKEYRKQPKLVLNSNIPNVTAGIDSLKVVFVLGETLRGDHLGINGYTRNTTPFLSKRKNVISFSELYTSNTITATSVPQLLTDKKLEDVQRLYTSVYSVANKAGFKTIWIGNQTLEKSFLPITETNDEVLLVDKYRSVFSFDKKLDEVMLKPMDSLLKRHHKQLITLHMIGSHWWYENRYRPEHRIYTPVIDSKYIPSLTKEQMINSYDNTVVYLDSFLEEIIRRLEKEKTPSVMVYVSDHGELLGEGGKWLHAQEGDALKNPGYIIWFSEAYTKLFPERVSALIKLKNEQITTDVIYPTLLELMDISVSE